MRIVYYVVGWPLERFPNGIVSAVGCLAPALRRGGHDVQILAYFGAPDPGEPAVIYVGAAIGPRRDFPPLRMVKDRLVPNWRTFSEAPRNIAQRFNASPALGKAEIFEMEESFGWNAAVAKRIAATVVTRLHGPYFLTGAALKEDEFSDFETARIRREGEAIRRAPFVTAPSKFVLDAVRDRYDCALEGARVIPNPARLVEANRGWRLEDADPNEILFVGRFDRIKGADILLRAFARLAARRPQIRLTFAGPTDKRLPAGDRSYAHDEYVRAVLPPDAAKRVNFLGPTPPDQIGALRRRAFATVISSRIEVFPNVMLEALAHGSPVAATRVGGIPEIARDGVEAILAHPEDPDDLARAVEALLDNRERAAALGEAGRKRAETEFAPDRIAGMTIDYYRSVLAARAARRDRTKAG